MIKNRCVKHYNTSIYLTVDERIVPFCGNCKFRVYMPAKPDKYGLKICMMADADKYYVKNFDVYLGKVNEKSETNQSQRVVMQLASCLAKGYNITVDNFFTSFSLAHMLLEKDITLLGTLRQNKKGIPTEMLSTDREVYSSKFMITEQLTLLSYCVKKKKNVLLLSSSRPDTRKETSEKKKPLMILQYNDTKDGVDIVDKMTKQYSVKRSSRRWTFALFTSLIDISLLNAYVLFSCIQPDHRIVRRQLHLSLAQSLCVPLIQMKTVTTDQSLMVAVRTQGKRCASCPGKREIKKTVSFFCNSCQKAVCPNHFMVECVNCVNESKDE